MQNKFKLYTPVIVTLMIISVLLTFATLFFDSWLFIICCIILVVGFSLVFYLLSRANNKMSEAISDLGKDVYYINHKAFADSNLPVMAVYNDYEIIWYNDIFLEEVLGKTPALGEHVLKIFPELDLKDQYIGENGIDIDFEDKKYTLFMSKGNGEHPELSILYFIENTKLKNDSVELNETRLSVAIVSIDNYSELSDNYEDIDRARVVGEIESAIKDYFVPRHSYIIRANRDRFMVFVEKRGVEAMREDKFEILNTIRNMDFIEKFSSTISIGIGHSENNDLNESESIAKQALDMCLGRGGDQAAIKTEMGYDFFGGVSSGVTQHTKIKPRIISSAIAELMEESSNIIIMGHRFPDLDALGASIGMLKAARAITTNSFICIDVENTLVEAMLKRLTEEEYTDHDFKHPNAALKAVNNKTLLIIVDAHTPNVLGSEELYEAVKSVIVIDHHRKLVNFINDAVIFYHEPSSSSASEMVTELIQYFPIEPKLTKLDAEALLAGITLDTKNFVMRTGVRTFEAAAWLKRLGADTVEVKKMFSSSMESYQNKTAMVSSTSVYKGCAIAYCEEEFGGIRVVSSQAADDLMNISGIIASFVVFPYGEITNVSARSMGDVNVQVIMESLGGGGHRTMAAAQFKDTNVDEILVRVKKAIDDYYTSLSESQLKRLDLTEDVKTTIETEKTDIVSVEGQDLSTVRAVED